MSIVVSVSTSQYVDIETDVELELDEFVEGLSDEDAKKLLAALEERLGVASETPTIMIPQKQSNVKEYVRKFDELNRLKR